MRVLPHSTLSAAVASLCLNGLALAQQPAPTPAGGNLIANGGFEKSFKRDNPWPGISAAGFLEGQRGTLPVLTQSGVIAETSMPVSVAVADMNADAKPDIVAADVLGYFRVYFNQGTAQEPKFADADLIPVFLSRTPHGSDQFRYSGPRISVSDFARTGKNDILFGNYIGQILWLKNQGSISSPGFQQPKTADSILVPTTQDSQRRWGNVFAPAAWDWNRDGKFDLLLGEGSYSANNIHLLLNQGSGALPKFDETNRHFLAYGDGREQLTPAVEDYNGDGRPDVLVADRAGKIGLYLNDQPNWKPGDEIKFTSYVPIQGQAGKDLTFGGICTVTTGDLNGDGLFDLVVGKTNGRITVAYNRGTQAEPKFDAPIELKGETKASPFQPPSGWEVDFGLNRGNFLGYGNAESNPQASAPEGKQALRLGYLPNSNAVIKTPFAYLPALDAKWTSQIGENGAWAGMIGNSPANYFFVTPSGKLNLTPGKSYVMSFKVKGTGATDTKVFIAYGIEVQLGESRVVQGERNSAKVERNLVGENKLETLPFSSSPGWTTVTKEFKVQFTNKELNDPAQKAGVGILFVAALAPGKGELYIDDVQLTEKK
ncbi:MAG TPA: VCBS repeat-containing protein [Chthoniobacterales bacterium]